MSLSQRNKQEVEKYANWNHRRFQKFWLWSHELEASQRAPVTVLSGKCYYFLFSRLSWFCISFNTKISICFKEGQSFTQSATFCFSFFLNPALFSPSTLFEPTIKDRIWILNNLISKIRKSRFVIVYMWHIFLFKYVLGVRYDRCHGICKVQNLTKNLACVLNRYLSGTSWMCAYTLQSLYLDPIKQHAKPINHVLGLTV